MLPTSWKDVEASRKLIEYGQGLKHPGVLGHLFTSWSKPEKLADWPPLAANAGLVRTPAAEAGSGKTGRR